MSAIAQGSSLTVEIKHGRSYAVVGSLLADIAALELSVWLGCLLRFLIQPLIPIGIGTAQYAGICLGILTLPLAYCAVGLYPGYGMGAVQRLRARVYATLLVFSVLLGWNYVHEHGQWSRGVLFGTMLFALVLPPALETLVRTMLTKAGLCGIPVVVVGAGAAGKSVVQRLKQEWALGLIPVVLLDDDEDQWHGSYAGVPIAGPVASVQGYREHAKVAIIAMPGLGRDGLLRMIEDLPFSSVIVVPDLPEMQSLWTVSRDLGGVIGLELRKNLLLQRNRMIKRAVDYAIAVPLCAFALPVIAVSVVCIKAVSPGPAFFRQEREGEGGRTIRIWKLRTMYPNAERVLNEYLNAHPPQRAAWNRFFKLKKDPRVLPGIGTFLRAFSLDELPQLWNVLMGEMSLVGPRPFPQYHLRSFPDRFRRLRRSVRPGITGLWQVSERSDGDIAVQEAHDSYYIRNWSVWLDIYILLRTVRTVLFAKGAY